MNSIPIRIKIIVGVLAVLLAGAVLIMVMLQQSYSTALDSASTSALRTAQSNFESVQGAETSKLYALLDALSSDPEIAASFAAREREGLSELTAPRFDILKANHGINRWYFYMPPDDGTVFLRAYKGKDALDPAEYGDVSSRATYLRAAETNDKTAGFELGKTALALRVAAPFVYNGENLGVMALGAEIDGFLEGVAALTGDTYAMYFDKQYFKEEDWAASRESAGLEDDWDARENVILAWSTGEERALEFDESIAELPEDGILLDGTDDGGRQMIRGAFPVLDAAGDKVAAVIVLHDATAALQPLQDAQSTFLIGIPILMVVLSALIVLMLNSLVFSRLKSMQQHIEDASIRLAGGDYGVAVPDTGSRDEIGSFEKFVGDFISMMAKTLSGMARK